MKIDIINSKKNKGKLNNNTELWQIFCEYNNYIVSLVKDVGFTMTLSKTNMKVASRVYKHTIPREGMINTTSVDYIAKIIN